GQNICRVSSPAVSNSVSQLPARLPADRRFCLQTNRLVTSILTTAKRLCICSASCIRVAPRFAWSRTTSVLLNMQIAPCTCLMAGLSRTVWPHKPNRNEAKNADVFPGSSLRFSDAPAQSGLFYTGYPLPDVGHRHQRGSFELDRRNFDPPLSAGRAPGPY